MYEFAAARIAVTEDESAIMADAHSYTTAVDDELNSVRMQRMYFDLSFGLVRTTLRMSSRTTSCSVSL